MHRLILLALLALLVASSGCGTFSNLSDEVAFYGGVQKDLEYMEDPPLPQDDVAWWWNVDLPLSALFDTVLIPVYAMRAAFSAAGRSIDPDGYDRAKAEAKEREIAERGQLRKSRTNAPARPAPIRLKPRRSGPAKVDPLR